MSSPSIVLITGANTGLGFEVAKALFASSDAYHILVGCRGDSGRAEEAIDKLNALSPNTKCTAAALSIDISDNESIAAAVKQVSSQHDHIDALVNNAGVASVHQTPAGTREDWNAVWDVNVTGTHLTTEAFMPLLVGSPSTSPSSLPRRLLFITSGTSSLQELADGMTPRYTTDVAPGWPKSQGGGMSPFLSYSASKAAMNLMALEWARVLKGDGVKVFVVSPGFLATGIGGGPDKAARARELRAYGALDPAVGGGFVADVLAGKRDDDAWPTRVMRKDEIQPF